VPLTNAYRYASSVLRTAAALRRFLDHPPITSPPEQQIRNWLNQRESRFLSVVRQTIFEHPESPYLRLLQNAGCTYEDVCELVRKEGLEGALHRLYDAGVYVTHDEMKGRTPARRGSQTFRFTEGDFDNPLLTVHMGGETSGSSGKRTPVRVNFGHFATRAWQDALWLDALRLRDAKHAIWMPPTYSAVSRLMRLTRTGRPPRAWFSQIALNPLKPPRLTRVQVFGLAFLARLFGIHFPAPRHVSVTHPGPVVDWALRRLTHGRRVCIDTYTSSAVRACQWAHERGLPLGGVTFLSTGEPVTAARRAAIEATGARCYPLYGIIEHGMIAAGCLAPAASDDMHVLTDLNAVIARQRLLGAGQQASVLFETTLGTATAKASLNADTGDCGILEDRRCGCSMERVGYHLHVRDVCSHSKLTAEGLTFDGWSVLRVLDEVLPQRFGGQPGDYQLITEPAAGGVTRYILSVHPSVADRNPEAVRTAFLEGLGGHRGADRLAAEFLREAAQVAVVRRRPIVGAGGKSLPVMVRPAGLSAGQ